MENKNLKLFTDLLAQSVRSLIYLLVFSGLLLFLINYFPPDLGQVVNDSINLILTVIDQDQKINQLKVEDENREVKLNEASQKLSQAYCELEGHKKVIQQNRWYPQKALLLLIITTLIGIIIFLLSGIADDLVIEKSAESLKLIFKALNLIDKRLDSLLEKNSDLETIYSALLRLGGELKKIVDLINQSKK